MFHINTDERVLGYLGRALSLELSAVQLYSTQSMLVSAWGLTEVAEQFRAESREEMEHAERIISRMLALGVVPNASQIRPVRLGRNLQSLLQYNYVFEHELIQLYDSATHYCVSIADYDNRLFFEKLMNEEKVHAADLADWLQKLKQTNMPASTEK
jgi:bacterioferritin